MAISFTKFFAIPMMITICSTILGCGSSRVFDYPAAFNFGDSNSDTGNIVAGNGFSLGLPYGQKYFKTPSTGRFSDGRLIVDFLMKTMKMPFLNPYLDSLGSPNFHKGCNFAAAGSKVLPETASLFSPFSFGVQVNQFLHFKDRVLELRAGKGTPLVGPYTVTPGYFEGYSNLSAFQRSRTRDLSRKHALKFLASTAGLLLGDDYCGRKLGKYLPTEDFFHKGLYMFDIGQNDIDGAFYSKTLHQVLALIPTILAEFETGLQRLYDQGARNFWIHNTGPLGCLAQNVAKYGTDPSKLDEFGCIISHNQAAKLFNLQLHALSKKLQSQYADSNFTYIDIYSIKSNLIANYSRLGFEHPIMACCGYGGPPLNCDSRIVCGQTKTLNGTLVTAKGCDDSSKYINWDGVHYTEAANQYVSSQIFTGKYSDPHL